MEEPKLLRTILSDQETQHSLSWPFELNLAELTRINDTLWQVGQNDSGGNFFIFETEEAENTPLMFVSSEGQAGKIANSFEEGIELIVRCPYWQSVLKFSGNGNIEEMYKAAPHCKEEIIEDEPEFEKIQNRILSKLGIDRISDPILHLHGAVSSGDRNIRNLEGGDEYESLFGSFTCDQNPMWNK